MSARSADARQLATKLRAAAPVFAALGDPTRLHIVTRLCDGSALSIAQLTDGVRVTRQAVTKHLDVLSEAGLVRDVRSGRERRFELQPEPFDEVQHCLQLISAQWDRALQRLKDHLEG